MKAPLRGLLAAATILSLFAVAAAPAHAVATPFGPLSLNAKDGSATFVGLGSVTCPTSHFTGTVDFGGTSATGSLTYSRSIPPGGGDNTCRDSFGFSVPDPLCLGNISMVSGSSVAGTSASFTISFQANFRCTFRHPLAGDFVINGPQTPGGCTATFTQATQIMRLDCRTILTTTPAGGRVNLSGNYRVTSSRVTIS